MASTSLTTTSTNLAICQTPSRPRSMSASEGVADEVVPVEVAETKCPVVTIIPLVEPTPRGHLLEGLQRAMLCTIKVATTLEADLVGSFLDLKT